MGGPALLQAPKKIDAVQMQLDKEKREIEGAKLLLERYGYSKADYRFGQAAKVVARIAGETGAQQDEVLKTVLKKGTSYGEKNLLADLKKRKKGFEEKMAQNPALRAVPKKTETFGEKIVEKPVRWIESIFLESPEKTKERIEHLKKDIAISERRAAILERFEVMFRSGEPDMRDGARFIIE